MAVLEVWIDETLIGTLTQYLDCSEVFEFASAYVELPPNERPVLGQLFEDRLPNAIQVGGPIGWFDHLLPQGALRKWQASTLDLSENDSFELLAALGEDLPGAVRLRSPDHPTTSSATAVDSDQSRKGTMDLRLKFSLAGMQWKLSARSSARGLTIRGSDGDQAVIVKFEAPGYLQVPRVEAATMAWADRFGISIPPCGLRNANEFDELPDGLPIGEGDIFVIERFDRSRDNDRPTRIHMEDFAQILDRPRGNTIYEGSYEMIAKIIAVLCPQDLMEFVRRVVFSVCCGNGDAHLKNFSLQYLEGRRTRLSPGYDFVATVIYGDKDLALNLGGSKDWMITNERFDELIQLLCLESSIQATLLSGMLQRAGETFLEIESLYPNWHRDGLIRHFKEVPLLKPLHDLVIRSS